MKTETLIELQRSITQGGWVKSGFNVYDYKTDHFLLTTGDAVSAPREEKSANARAIALVPELIAEVIRLREALRACADELDELAYGENALGKTGEHVPIPVDALALDSARAALANDK